MINPKKEGYTDTSNTRGDEEHFTASEQQNIGFEGFKNRMARKMKGTIRLNKANRKSLSRGEYR